MMKTAVQVELGIYPLLHRRILKFEWFSRSSKSRCETLAHTGRIAGLHHHRRP